MEGLPWRDETSGVTPEGEGVQSGDGRGQGIDENSPSTWYTEGPKTEREAIMASRPGQAEQLRPQWDGTASNSGRDKAYQQVSKHSHSTSAGGARPERCASHKYGTLVLEELAGDTASMGDLGSRDNPKETMETVDTVETVETVEMEIGEPYRQCGPPARGQLEEEC